MRSQETKYWKHVDRFIEIEPGTLTTGTTNDLTKQYKKGRDDRRNEEKFLMTVNH